ncbi:pectinesterase inhibitor 28 [Triticum aestivum]|nr:pectinesterase inhibitor 28 [Aegilops tauschii subsp. strangulata]XP_044358668.1 pectinesterase inhibitor 28-like [Triticum aestivum]
MSHPGPGASVYIYMPNLGGVTPIHSCASSEALHTPLRDSMGTMAPSPALLPVLLLLPLLLLSVVCTAGAAPAATATVPTIPSQPGKPNSNNKQKQGGAPLGPAVRALVQSTCNATTYYDLCVAALVADPASSTADLRGLCAIAVSAAAANASATASALANTTWAASGAPEPGSDGRAQQVPALLTRTCAGKYGEAREALLEARESVGEEAYDYAFVHVGAAAEYPAVCRTMFRRKRVPYPVELARREEALEHLCTVVIDIITLLA